MNGIHDLGGMQDMGTIPYEKTEPVFHERWEGRIFALNRATGAWRKWNLDASRFQRELIPPAEYLRMSYYERWVEGLVGLLVKMGLVTQEEITSGKPSPRTAKLVPPLTPDKVWPLLARGAPANRDVASEPRFQAGQPVRARNIHPEGHTRLPRYARGKAGMIVRDHGVFVYPDTNALFQGEQPRHLYSVRFSAQELWGPEASAQDSVYLDMWESYLEPA
ncbi:MAG: nitrile hydratase subunit beta [Steroidobacteraceae bacterium]|jgi:nitrile hydratase subunit beta